MLLRLVPEQPNPTILFTLAFNNLPDGLPFPAAWTAQLQNILHDELEMPQCIHALDKAAWAACLLYEVTFSIAARRVSVVFVDGTSGEWPLEDDKLFTALKEVMDDVSESSVAAEMEQRRAQAIQAAAQAQAIQERMPAAPTTPTPSTKGKHKKSRSLLMTLVASFCPSSHSASIPLPLSPPRPIAPAELAPPPPEPPQSSRYLRRKARAGLVDIYRRYILPTLTLDSPYSFNRSGLEGGQGGGYVLWNLQSILRRIEVRMHELGAELGSTSLSRSSSLKSYKSKANAKRHRVTPSVLSESPFEEEETSSASGTGDGEGSAESTETEASSVSVQTPRAVSPAYPLLCAFAQEEDNARIKKEGGIINPVSCLAPSSSSPTGSSSSQRSQSPFQARARSHRPTKRQSQPPTPQKHLVKSSASAAHQAQQQHEYAILHASTIRLRALIARTSEFTHAQAEERHVALVQLERRSRRRAWSNGQLMGGAWVNMGMKEGLGIPLRASGLRRSWTTTSAETQISSVVGDVRLHGRLQGLGLPHGPPSVLSQIPKQVDLLPAPPCFVPSQAKDCVPFPESETTTIAEEGDDFCSTGPQDTSTLFGAGEDGEEFDSECLEPASGEERTPVAPYARSQSSDDLPSLFSSLSTTPSSSSSSPSSSPSPPLCDFSYDFASSAAFEDADTDAEIMEEMELGRLTMFGGEEFTSPLDFESESESESGMLAPISMPMPIPVPVPDCKSKLGRDMMGLGRGMGMGAKLLVARRRAALI